ncbi:flagellar biosynthesis protein FliQ [Bordetella bronchialis]|uniref:Flagellar biosynthetic protein FliQ n=1 Tax=Bordetella bronchialis TaxID=463025 RepID=A0A193FW95_9BORD|nr:flagellar biosynthesis protein FliQ [Bordetella bronchialis]ANN66819.1 EscS/YscS/HrcS family type III secretion system export apparatus protein [Bordetella bronchialis]ANN71895.1 EscS/YscS/HrcS family type III secretion system export apparatus protein [Bordetella bronchialis]
MDAETVMTLTYQAMRMILIVAGPLLLVTLLVGLLISVFQAATQINEMTLSFIPKLVAVAGTLVLLGPWLIGMLTDYIRQIMDQIPHLVS